MTILDRKYDLRPIMYPKFKDARDKVCLSPWHHSELDIEPDLNDWVDRLSEAEKSVIGNLFKAFTSVEGVIGDFWRHVGDIAGHPEIINMAAGFSHQEGIHMDAYDFLEAHLPMEDTVAVDWKIDPVAKKKMEDIISFHNLNDFTTALMAFSAFCEGVSLYASFATLMSFTKKGLLNTMFQVMQWSVRDERLHSIMGVELAKQLVREGLGVIDKDACYEMAELVVNNEIDFTVQAFGDSPDLGFVTLEQALSFIRHRANLKLMQIGLKPVFKNDFTYKPLGEFFYTALEGRGVNDFFVMSRNGGGYASIIKQNFRTCNFEKKIYTPLAA